MLKLVMLDGKFYPAKDAYVKVEAICKAKGVEFKPLYCATNDELIEQARDADACLLTDRKIDESFLTRVPRMKMFVRCGIGVDNLNLADFTRHGVYACNVPDYCVEEVAVHTLALVLALERKVPLYSASVHSGEWNEEIGYDMRRISQRTFGFLGFGKISRRLAGFVKALDYTLIAYDPLLPDEEIAKFAAAKVSLDELFARSDVLAVMAPANKDTNKIINDANLAKARDGISIVTTSRGTLVDLPALVRGLDSGKVRCAALDVLEQEPPREKCSILMNHPNIILTPHVSYRSVESLESMRTLATETAVDFLAEGKLRNVVNPDVIGRAKKWPV
jgi:D-3-phosphoglycerate dehydrogenase